jgi:hypothetical protein
MLLPNVTKTTPEVPPPFRLVVSSLLGKQPGRFALRLEERYELTVEIRLQLHIDAAPPAVEAFVWPPA